MVEIGSGGGVSLSVGALCRVTRGRAPLLWIMKDKQKRLWRWASLSIGTLEEGSYIRDFGSWMKGLWG
jgi:hypothetical protein